MGINLSEGTLNNVTFDNCMARYSICTLLRCKNVLFKECTFTSTDFYKSQFTNVEFLNSELIEAQMHETSLKGIDLTSCSIDGIGLNIEDLKGCIVGPEQLMCFANLLGVILK